MANIEVTNRNGKSFKVSPSALKQGFPANSKNLVLTSFTAHEGAIPNITMWDGEVGASIKDTASDSSGIKIIPPKEWSSRGWEIVRISDTSPMPSDVDLSAFRGREFAINVADWTANEIARRAENEQVLEDSDVDTVAGLKEQLANTLATMQDMMRQMQEIKAGTPSEATILEGALEEALDRERAALMASTLDDTSQPIETPTVLDNPTPAPAKPTKKPAVKT